jgi:aryl-alcohol dehydrogenase-like predicted oxidoreductase/FMN phosphatase YigB (HAD superfamily)
MLPTPQALLLDFGGVIVDGPVSPTWPADVATILIKVLADAGVTPLLHYAAVSEALVAADRAADVSALDDRKNKQSSPTFWRTVVDAWPASAQQVVLEHADRLSRCVAELKFARMWQVRPGIADLLMLAVELGMPMAIVSNAISGAVHREFLDASGLAGYFATQVYSDEQGVKKPDPELVWRATAALGISSEDCWFVGDMRSRDVLSARRARCGAAILIPSARIERPPYPESSDPDLVLNSPSDLCVVLRRLAKVGSETLKQPIITSKKENKTVPKHAGRRNGSARSNTQRVTMMPKQRLLGRTSLMVSEVGHGLWGMGSWSDSDDNRSVQTLRFSVDQGCNFFDSAMTYGDGKSDSFLGQILKPAGSGALVVTSKVPPANGQFPGRGITAKYEELYPVDYVTAMAQQIANTMKIRTIPLLQLHIWDDNWTDDPAFARTIRELKERELIDHFGVSLNRWEPSNGVYVVESGLVDTVQVVYNIFNQAPEDKLFPASRRSNVGVIARVPFDEGSLTGGISASTVFPSDDWRSGYFNSRNLRQTVARVDNIRATLPQGMPLAEAALRFTLSSPDVSTVIIGMRSKEHVRENLAFSSLGPLPASLLGQLRAHRWDRGALP